MNQATVSRSHPFATEAKGWGTASGLKFDSRRILRCEVAGDVEDQLRDSRREGIDLSIGAGHDRHVVGDRAIQRVQGRDQRFRIAVGP